MTASVTVRRPKLLFKAPPLPVVLAPEIVTPETVKSALEPILKMLKLRDKFPLSPLMVSVAEPGPAIPNKPLFAMVGNALPAKVITPGPPVKSDESNTINSLELVALAAVIASRNESTLSLAFMVSAKVVTVTTKGTVAT